MKCAACWAFAGIGVLETAYYLETGDLRSFSEQQLIDCAKDNGCIGGHMIHAYSYLKNYGLMDTEDYPYLAE